VRGANLTSGVYILVIKLESGGSYPIGKLGALDFPAGYYCYVGSALNGVEARISRHFRPEKKLHWHIDYLLQHAAISATVYAEIPRKRGPSKHVLREECRIARYLARFFAGVRGFGCSDCRCPSHLFYSESAAVLRARTAEAFSRAKLTRVHFQPVSTAADSPAQD